MFRGILQSAGWTSLLPVHEGWSGDEKYRVTSPDGEYLLRLSGAERRERRRQEFETLRRLQPLEVNIPGAVDFGDCEGGVYTLLTWVEGRPAEEVLPLLDPSQQAAAGAQAGKLLRALHSLHAPATAPDWAEHFGAKMQRKLRLHHDCPVQPPACQDFAAYVSAGAPLLVGRPSTFQHGDYHVGNMVLDAGGKLGVVDFDRMDWGDPWEEFNRLPWCVDCSPVFARAMLRAYFGGDPPRRFWPLLALYVASNQLSAVPWALSFGQEQIDIMTHQCEQVRAWYSGAYGQGIPVWYTKTEKNRGDTT